MRSRAIMVLRSRILLPQSLDGCSPLYAPLRECHRLPHATASVAAAAAVRRLAGRACRLVTFLLCVLKQLVHLELELRLGLVVPPFVFRLPLTCELSGL